MKRVLITGGSRGIGLAFAKKCIKAGHAVITMQRNPVGIAMIPSVRLDLDWPYHMIKETTQQAIHDLGGLDWLVLAGGMGAYVGIQNFDPDVLIQMMKTNYLGPRYVLQASLRALYRRLPETSRVLWLGSTVVNAPGASALEDYAATKGAVHGFLASFARHYARWQISTTVLATSWVDTPMTDAIRDENPGLYAKILKHIPLRRMATVDEAADAMYAILDGPPFWHGDIVPLTGGAG